MTVQPAESQSEVHAHVAVALSAQILDSSVVGQWREAVQRRLQLDPNSVDWTWFVSDAAGCSLQLLNSKFDRTARRQDLTHRLTSTFGPGSLEAFVASCCLAGARCFHRVVLEVHGRLWLRVCMLSFGVHPSLGRWLFVCAWTLPFGCNVHRDKRSWPPGA